MFASFCDEFLIHAVDVEGKVCGIEKDLVALLGRWNRIPITYAGGIRYPGGYPQHSGAAAGIRYTLRWEAH